LHLSPDLLHTLWHGLGWPLARLLVFVSIGLLVANFIEALNWTQGVAKLAGPLIRLGNLSEMTGASFSVAFFSGVSANTMLSEAYEQKKISKRELALANLFNSLPTYFLHLPTIFFITAPLIKGAAFIYVGLTFAAAILRTCLILIISRFLLPRPNKIVLSQRHEIQKRVNLSAAWRKTWIRFKKRIKTIVVFTVPIYTGIFFLTRMGMFNVMKTFMSKHLAFLSWLDPQSIGIVLFHVAAEFTAGVVAAGALLNSGSLGYREIVLALLAGNVLSSPMRAVRHQFPYYAGIFSPRLALELIFYSQFFRVGSIIIIGVVYYYY